MIVNLRRKVGLATGQQTPNLRDESIDGDGNSNEHSMLDAPPFGPAGSEPPVAGPALPPITLQDLNFSWPSDVMFSPTSIPRWLQETVSMDFRERDVLMYTCNVVSTS